MLLFIFLFINNIKHVLLHFIGKASINQTNQNRNMALMQFDKCIKPYRDFD